MKKDGRLARARRAKMPGVRSCPAGRSGRRFRRFAHQGANRISAFFNNPLEARCPRFRQRYFKLTSLAETYVPAVGVLFESNHGAILRLAIVKCGGLVSRASPLQQ
jgi:hypothetical protein